MSQKSQSLLDYLVENEPSFRKYVSRVLWPRLSSSVNKICQRARLPALYSSFAAQRTLNPDGYAANLSAWRRALAKVAKSGLAPPPTSSSKPSLLVLNTDERLVSAFETKQYGRPLSLGLVIKEAVENKELVPLRQFLEQKESIYSRSWSVWGLAGWVLKTAGVTDFLKGSGDKVPKGQFVVVENVEGAGKAFGEGIKDKEGRFERTFTRAHFTKVFNDQLVEGGRELSDTDMDVLLVFLARDKQMIDYDGKTVKIRDGEGEPEGLTDEDASIAQLKELLASLTHQTLLLSKRVEELGAQAKEAVTKQNRVAALAALKSKKLAEQTLEKRYATVNQLEQVQTQLEQASDNVQIVKVMESSSDALKSLTAKVGGVEGVEEVVDRLREQMADADEVGKILAEASGTTVLDEGEIDDELAEMERQEKKKERKKVEERQQREAEERAKEEQKEAEDLRKKLEAIGEVPGSAPVKDKETDEAEAMMGRLTLG